MTVVKKKDLSKVKGEIKFFAFYSNSFVDTQENGFEQYGQQPPQNGAPIEPKKVPLRLVMDPRHVQDANSMKQFGYEPTPMSPEYGHELVNALNSSNTKGCQ